MLDECRQTKLDHLPDRTPVNGTFELTVRCNLHCKMCLFRHDDSENAEIMNKELTAAQWIDMARQVAKAGTVQLLITGGEPLLRQDFCEIWEGIYKTGFITTLYTNATLVTPKVMETLRKYPPHKIGVTIYGASSNTYEKVTGNADAFEKTLEGIALLKTLPSQIYYRTTVIQDNLRDLDKIDELIRQHFDPNPDYSVAQNVYKSVRGGCADIDSCRIDPEEQFRVAVNRAVYELRLKVGERFKNGHIGFRWDDTADSDHRKDEVNEYTLFGCHAGMKSYAVSWNGQLLGCQLLDMFSKDINGDFKAAWNRFPLGISIPALNDECAHCSLLSKCTICPAVLLAETGTLYKKPEYICKYTKSREEFVQKIKTGRVQYEDL